MTDHFPDISPRDSKYKQVDSSRTTFFVVIAGIGLAIAHVAIAYPGIMTYDSKTQYVQAVSGIFGDWHPPVMAVLWRGLLTISDAGTGFLFLHVAFYWASLIIMAAALTKCGYRVANWVPLAIGLLPSTYLLTTFIHKDVGFSVSLTLAFSLVFLQRVTGRSLTLRDTLILVPLLSYAVLVRTNGILAVAPLSLYAWWPALYKSRRFLPYAAAITAFALVISIPVSTVVNRYVFDAKNEKAIGSLVLFDLAGVAYFSGNPNVFPSPRPSADAINRCYESYYWDSLNAGECARSVGFSNGTKTFVKAKALPAAILHHPLAYAAHKLSHFNQELFAFTRSRDWVWGINPAFQNLPKGRIEDFTIKAIDRFLDVPPLVPAVSFSIVTACLLLCLRYRSESALIEASAFLSLSAVIYTIGFLLIGVASVYRYQQYLMTAAPLSILFLILGLPSYGRKSATTILASVFVISMFCVGASRLIL